LRGEERIIESLRLENTLKIIESPGADVGNKNPWRRKEVSKYIQPLCWMMCSRSWTRTQNIKQ